MSVIVLAAASTTLILNGRVIDDLEEGDVFTLAAVNPRTSHVNGTDGGVTIKGRSDAGVYDLTIRAQRLSGDDAWLNNLLRQDPPALIAGSMKEAFNRDGTDGVESWVLENGSFTTQPGSTKNTTDGSSDSTYVIRFRNASRNL